MMPICTQNIRMYCSGDKFYANVIINDGGGGTVTEEYSALLVTILQCSPFCGTITLPETSAICPGGVLSISESPDSGCGESLGLAPVGMASPVSVNDREKAAARTPLPCVLRGSPAPARGRRANQVWVMCESPRKPLGAEVCTCAGCGPNCVDYAVSSPLRVIRIDDSYLNKTEDKRVFNASILDVGGETIMAYRAGWYDPSKGLVPEIHLAWLDKNWKPIRVQGFDLSHPSCLDGCEDPRIFAVGDAVGMMFAGLRVTEDGKLRVSQMLAGLSNRTSPQEHKVASLIEVKRPDDSRLIEKNWSPFYDAGNNRMSFVYTSFPLSVYDVTGRSSITKAEAAPARGRSFPGRNIRGGAPPVLVGDVYWHWFHTWQYTKETGYTYTVGVYEFTASRPHRITRMTRGSVWNADQNKGSLNVTQDKQVIYPCGAIKRGPYWYVSAGHQDSEILIGQFDHDEISGLMEEVS